MRVRATLRRLKKRFFAPSILVIGSAHLDIIGRYETPVKADIDKIGTVDISPGGTALNIAFYANRYLNIRFVTAFRRESILYSTIIRLLGMAGISARYVSLVEADHLGGFSAHYHRNELVSAVTQTLAELLDIEVHLRRRWIEKSACTVCDFNLLAHQVAHVEKLCREYGRKLVLAGVSQAKCMRIRDLIAINKNPEIFLFVLNRVEAQRLFEWNPRRFSPGYAREICNSLFCRWIVVTVGTAGYYVLGRDGETEHLGAPTGVRVVSSSGAGDALLAGFAVSIAQREALDLADASKRASEFVTECLALPTPIDLRGQSRYRALFESLQIWDSKLGRPKLFSWLVIVTSFLYSLASLVGKIGEVVRKLGAFLGIAGP